MPLVTGTWDRLQQSDYEQTLPDHRTWSDGTNWLHFTKPTSRTKIDQLVATFGWSNMYGVFVSGSGGPDAVPDWIMHRSEFPLADIHAAPTVTVAGQTGTTTWAYKVVALDSSGLIQGATGAETRITNGRAAQNANNGNDVSWTAVSGAASYDVYLTAGPLTLGKLTSTASTSYQHRGAVGDGATAPTQTQVTAISKSMDDAATALYRNASGDRSFWIRTHFWRYKTDGSYVSGGSANGDYVFTVAQDDVPSNWWQGM